MPLEQNNNPTLYPPLHPYDDYLNHLLRLQCTILSEYAGSSSEYPFSFYKIPKPEIVAVLDKIEEERKSVQQMKDSGSYPVFSEETVSEEEIKAVKIEKEKEWRKMKKDGPCPVLTEKEYEVAAIKKRYDNISIRYKNFFSQPIIAELTKKFRGPSMSRMQSKRFVNSRKKDMSEIQNQLREVSNFGMLVSDITVMQNKYQFTPKVEEIIRQSSKEYIALMREFMTNPGEESYNKCKEFSDKFRPFYEKVSECVYDDTRPITKGSPFFNVRPEVERGETEVLPAVPPRHKINEGHKYNIDYNKKHRQVRLSYNYDIYTPTEDHNQDYFAGAGAMEQGATVNPYYPGTFITNKPTEYPLSATEKKATLKFDRSVVLGARFFMYDVISELEEYFNPNRFPPQQTSGTRPGVY